MAVKIRLKRMGKIRAPFYRIVVADSRTKRDGRAIEEIGKYHPTREPSYIEVESDRVQYWLSVGAQPTEQVLAILKVTGDWQKFKGEPGAEGTLKVAAPKADKRAVFEAAARATMDQPKDGATTPKARKGAAASGAGEETAVTEQPAETAATEQPADAADEGAPGGSETSAQTAEASTKSQAEGDEA